MKASNDAKEDVYHWENLKIHKEFQHLFKAYPSRPCTAQFRIRSHVPVPFVVGHNFAATWNMSAMSKEKLNKNIK